LSEITINKQTKTADHYDNRCDTCGEPVKPENLTILWSEIWPGGSKGQVYELAIVHQRFRCNNKRMECSVGAPGGPDWETKIHRNYFEKETTFLNDCDRQRIFRALDFVDRTREERRKRRLS